MPQATTEPATDASAGKTDPGVNPGTKSANLPPASVAAQAAAERMRMLSSALLPEAKAVANDPKLQPLFPSYFGMTANGDYVVLPMARPDQLLQAVERIQEIAPDMAGRIQSRLKASQDLKAKLPIKQTEDEFLAKSDPAQVLQRLTVLNRFLTDAQGAAQAPMQQSLAAHVDQLMHLLEPRKDQKTSEIQVLAAQLLGRLGPTYAGVAREKLAQIGSTTHDEKLKAACAEALKALGPEPAATGAAATPPAQLPVKPPATK